MSPKSSRRPDTCQILVREGEENRKAQNRTRLPMENCEGAERQRNTHDKNKITEKESISGLAG